jgi:hypothetical protein
VILKFTVLKYYLLHHAVQEISEKYQMYSFCLTEALYLLIIKTTEKKQIAGVEGVNLGDRGSEHSVMLSQCCVWVVAVP